MENAFENQYLENFDQSYGFDYQEASGEEEEEEEYQEIEEFHYEDSNLKYLIYLDILNYIICIYLNI